VDFSLYRFPDDMVHVSRVLGQNTGVVQLDTMAQVTAVFNNDGLLRMVETDVSVIFFDPRLNRTLSMSDV
jgi:hypothetical protein